jgi:hypothetical protein
LIQQSILEGAMSKKTSLYVSEVTQFINQLKAHNPELEQQQREGRALLWDKRVNFEELKDFGNSRAPKKPYEYYSNE